MKVRGRSTQGRVRTCVLVATVAAVLGATSQAQAGPNAGFILEWGSKGTGPGQFDQPEGVTVDGAGNVYVSDSENHRIQKFTPQGDFLAAWGSFGGRDNEFEFPGQLASDSAGNVYVTDTGTSRVQVYGPNGSFQRMWGRGVVETIPGFSVCTADCYAGGEGNEAGEFAYPNGVAVDGAGNVYVSDTRNHRIQKFTTAGAFVTAWGGKGSAPGQFNEPEGVAVDPAGNVYVADLYNDRVQKFNSDGAFITQWKTDSQPVGVSVDRAGNVYVVEAGRIEIFTSDGASLFQFGASGSSPGEFDFAHQLAFDASGNAYVTDKFNHRIQKLNFCAAASADVKQAKKALKRAEGRGKKRAKKNLKQAKAAAKAICVPS